MSSIAYRRRAIALSGAAALLSVVAVSAAHAGGFALREQSTTGQGMSFAGMAAGGGDSLSGMFWNPAVVNQVEHLEGEQNVTGVFPSSDINVKGSPFFAAGRDSDIGKNAALTSGYNAYRVSDMIAIGLSFNAPFGLATKADRNFGGEFFGTSSKALSINAAPTVGVKVNEWFSVAAGVQIQYFDIKLKQKVGPNPVTGERPRTQLDGDDIGVGFTAGFTVTPTEWTSIGVGFRSSVEHKLKGDFFGAESLGVPDGKIKAKVELPELVTVGVRQRVSEQLTLLGGVEWTNWSRLGTIPVNYKGGGQLTTLPFEYKDGWFFSGGVEFDYSPNLTLRTGVAYEKSPITNKTRSVRIPDDDRWWLSAGGTYNYSEKLSFDLGYSYVFVPGKSKIEINPGDPDSVPVQALVGPFNAYAKSEVHIVSAAVRYKFGVDPAPALVTKY